MRLCISRGCGIPSKYQRAAGTIGLAALLALIFTPAVRAQQPEELTLKRTLELAERRNLDLLAARIAREVAQAGVRTARQVPNPTLIFGAARDTPHESLLLDQPLEIGVRGRRIELAQETAGLADADIAALERRVRRRAREAFYTALYAQAIVAQRRVAHDLAQRLRQIAGERFDAGDVPQLEVLQADVELAQAQLELSTREKEEQVAQSRLNTVINETPGQQWRLAGTLEDGPAALVVADLTLNAQASNAGLRRIEQELRVERKNEALLEAERNPQLTLEVGSDFNSPGEFRAGPRGQLAVTLPLFSRNQGQLAESRAKSHMLELEAQAARRSVAGEVEAGYLEWDTRRTQVQVYQQSVLPAAERLAALAAEGYRAGEANILTVLDAQRNVARVRNDYLASLLALQTALAALEETVGTPLD